MVPILILIVRIGIMFTCSQGWNQLLVIVRIGIDFYSYSELESFLLVVRIRIDNNGVFPAFLLLPVDAAAVTHLLLEHSQS